MQNLHSYLRLVYYWSELKVSIVLPSVIFIGAILRQVSVTTCNFQMTRLTGEDNKEEQDPLEQDHRLIIPPKPPMVRGHLVPLYFVLYLRTTIRFDQGGACSDYGLDVLCLLCLSFGLTGYYMFIEASSPRKQGDNAMIGSAVFTPTSTCQVRFFYHMYGRHIGTLNVYTRTSTTGPMNKIWTKTGAQGDKWVKATASISVSSNFQVSLSSSDAIKRPGLNYSHTSCHDARYLQ